MVQMNVTVPHLQKESALTSLRFAQGQALSEAKDLSAERDRPFASLRVTRWDSCNGEGLFFTTEPCLNEKNGKRAKSPPITGTHHDSCAVTSLPLDAKCYTNRHLSVSPTPLDRGSAPIHTANAALAASASHSSSVKGAVLRTQARRKERVHSKL